MKFRSFVYSLLVYFDVIIFIRSQSQPTCITGDIAKKFTDKMVKDHNNYRSLHGVPPLVADNALTEGSIDWSKELALKNTFEHSPNLEHKYGENLYQQSYTGGAIDESSLNPVKPWYDEIKDYHGSFTQGTGHYTQVVWKSSQKVGCGVCAFSTSLVVTCRYGPPGNIIGQFEENVLPAKSATNNPSSPTDKNDPPRSTSKKPSGTRDKNHVSSSETPTTNDTDTDNTKLNPNPNANNLKVLLFIMISTLFILGLIVAILLFVIIYYYAMYYRTHM